MEAPSQDDPFRGAKLELEYPCTWMYTVIAEDEAALQAAVTDIVEPLRHSLSFSNESREGRYRSYQLEVVVHTNEERLRVFRELHAHADVRYVF